MGVWMYEMCFCINGILECIKVDVWVIPFFLVVKVSDY